MTTQRSYSEKTNIVKNYGFSFKYFLGELRRSWPFAVFIFAAFLFIMPVAAMMLISGAPVSMPGVNDVTNEDILEYVLRQISGDCFMLWGLVVAGFAMLGGWIGFKYLSSKVHSDFVHCLPIRREAVFATKFLTSVIDFIVGFVPNIFLTVIMCSAVSGLGTYGIGDILSVLCAFMLKAFLLYFTVLTITTLAGQLSGTVIMHIFMTFFLNFAMVVYYVMFYLLLYIYSNNINAQYYWSFNTAADICPIIKLFYNFIETMSAFDIFAIILLDVILIFVSIVLYKIRKVERAGTPIVFEPVARILKYLCIIPCTFFLGALMSEMNGGSGWLTIGYIFGGIFSFMFMNCILAKNTRKMFAGIKGFAVYAGVFVLVIVGCNFNIFGIDNYVPKSSDLKSVEININNLGSGIEIKEYKLKTDILNFYKDHLGLNNAPVAEGALGIYSVSTDVAYDTPDKIYKDERYIYDLEYEIDGVEYAEQIDVTSEYKYRSTYIEMVFKLENGIHFAVKLHPEQNAVYSELLCKIVDSKEFSEQIVSCIDPEKISYANFIPLIWGKDEIFYPTDSEKPSDQDVAERMLEIIKEAYSGKNILKDNSVIIGSFRVRTTDNKVFYIPVFSSFEGQKLFTGYNSEEEFFAARAEDTECLIICDVASIDDNNKANDCSVKITDKEQIKDILSSAYSLDEYSNGAYLSRENRYTIIYVVKEHRADDYSVDEKSYTPVTYRTWFKSGEVPSFVPDMFN